MFPRSSNQVRSFSCNPKNYQNFTSKKSRETIDFLRCFGLVFRNSFDTGNTRNQITEDPATITRNTDNFMRLKGTYKRASS